jgi:hypothetical protein
MLERVVSGGQSGVAQAALRAAKSAHILTGGFAPKGWLAEVEVRPGHWEYRPCPWLADFGLIECPEPGFPARTRANVKHADMTLWLGKDDSPGYRCTRSTCRTLGKRFWAIDHEATPPASLVAALELQVFLEVLNVAGTRESRAPGIGKAVQRYLMEVFRILKESLEPS